MQKHKLDEKIDEAIAALLPSPLARIYLAVSRWCDRHIGLMLVALLLGAFVALALTFINNQPKHTK